MSGERCLIVNADDFGRSPGINQAIIDCHVRGIVTSTTLMVNLPWADEAVAMWRATPGLGLGLHLNFCYGSPVTDPVHVPSLVRPDGQFVTDTGWLRQHAAARDISTEARAQIERFCDRAGKRPTHLDSHKYLHSAPGIRTSVVEVASEYGLPVRGVTAQDRAAIRDAGLKTTDHFEGRFHGLDGVGVSTEILVMALRELPSGVSELMCHPGYVDEHILDSSYADDREREVAALTSSDVRNELKRPGIRLTRFDEI